MNRYIEHIINDLVRDTNINYDKEEIHYPFHLSTLPSLFSYLSYHFSHFPSPSFSEYCKNTYGLTEDEIKYVWNQYKRILEDKINE